MEVFDLVSMQSCHSVIHIHIDVQIVHMEGFDLVSTQACHVPFTSTYHSQKGIGNCYVDNALFSTFSTRLDTVTDTGKSSCAKRLFEELSSECKVAIGCIQGEVDELHNWDTQFSFTSLKTWENTQTF